jgi:hypothetical protein
VVIQSTHLEQSLFNYFISNIITFKPRPSLATFKHGKKQKTVKFSGINQVYLIHTIDEIKEFLPDMYWKYDAQIDDDDYNYKNVEKEFLPLTRNRFVYDLNTKNIHPNAKYATHAELNAGNTDPSVKRTTKQSKTPSIVIPPYLIENIERNTPHLSANCMFPDKIASCIFNTGCFDMNKCNDDVFKENTNSLPLILNELGMTENVVFSYPLHSSKYKLLPKDKIPTMFDGIQCHVKVGK